MPTYLSLSFQYSKRKLHALTVRSFCDALCHSGLTFTSGYWGSEQDSYSDIISWNQMKLAENFELGWDEHYTHDYKQMLFRFEAFSEVRLFIHNMRDNDSFSFELIIPEDDFFTYPSLGDIHEEPLLHLKQLEKVEQLAIRMWESETMDCILADWESLYNTTTFSDIAAGAPPLIEPFCIVPQSLISSKQRIEYQPIARNGAFIQNIVRFRPTNDHPQA